MYSQRSTASVAITTYNESDSIIALLESLVVQTVPPSQVVIADASTDDTAAKIRAFAQTSPVPIRVLARPGANISEGRNAAIGAASGEIIAVTDAGLRLDPQWLERITAPFEDPETHIVAGFFVSDPQTVFETAMGATVLPLKDEIDPERYLPSSRSVAFRKSAWKAAGGYPEWLDYCEDVIFDFRLRDLYGPFRFVPEATVHFRPRPNLRAFWRQYFHYARGDGKANLWLKRHLARYSAYLAAAGLVAAGLLVSPTLLLLLPMGAALYLRVPYRRLLSLVKKYSLADKIEAALWVPVIRVVGDLAKMCGYPVGVLWRWKRRAREDLRWKRGISDLESASAGSSRMLF